MKSYSCIDVPQGSCSGAICNPTPVLSPETQTGVTMAGGLSDTLPLAVSSNTMSTNWLLQSDGSYKPIRVKRPGHLTVSAMIPSSHEKSGGTTQTWGILATLIKRHETLLIESQLSSIVPSDDIDNEDVTSVDDTIDVEHDALTPWLSTGDDPEVDVLSLITVEGSPDLQRLIRILLEKHKIVFATILSSELARFSPFK